MLDSKKYAKALKVAKLSSDKILPMFNSSLNGLSLEQVEQNRKSFGTNNLVEDQNNDIFKSLKQAFVNPFSLILFVSIIIAIFTNVIFVSEFQRSYSIIVIMLITLVMSGLIRLYQEKKTHDIIKKLINDIENDNHVLRDGHELILKSNELVVGDIVKLKTNDIVGADLRIISSSECLVSESTLTGESDLVHKFSAVLENDPKNISGFNNILFAKTNIVSGECTAVVFAVGEDTLFGTIAPINKPNRNGFDSGSNSIVKVLIKFMLMIVPLVFVVSFITKGNLLTALMFSLSISIGLTPELLPIVFTACLVKGSRSMAKKKTIVKNINSMQMFGNIDVLCVDKTGTLTNDEIILEYYTDVLGNESNERLNYAQMSSYYATDKNNHIDKAILNSFTDVNVKDDISTNYHKINELPFDYKRKLSTILLGCNQKNLLIVKGNAEEVIKHCSYIKYKENILKIEKGQETSVHDVIDEILNQGMKVIAIAFKETNDNLIDENDLILLGYLVFFDAPKKSAKSAINKLNNLNINTKVLTGDVLTNALAVCKRIGINTERALTGKDLDLMSDDEALSYVENASLFAELNPQQKARIVSLLKINGHVVGYLGDGVNDLPAIYNANVAISVENASKMIKESSDVILFKKDLNVLEEGIIEGRKAFLNMTKYIKITASSNLGNILSMVIASALLPFFPMTSIQLLLLNLLYDALCLVLPWDNVDEVQIRHPLEWSGKNLSHFMCFFAPLSSVFDLITFACLIFFICPKILGFDSFNVELLNNQNFISIFQTAWFLESMWTQILILYSLRSKEISFKKSCPSIYMISTTLIGIIIISVLATSKFGTYFGLNSLPISYYLFLMLIVICYTSVINLAKLIYLKFYGELI